MDLRISTKLRTLKEILVATAAMTMTIILLYQPLGAPRPSRVVVSPSALNVAKNWPRGEDPAAPHLTDHQGQGRPHTGRKPSAGRDRLGDQRWRQCRRVLRMSETRFFWEGDVDQSRCRKTQRSVADLQEGLRQLMKLRGRPARLVFLGDSRVRILHESLEERLNLKPHSSNKLPIVYSEIYHSKEELLDMFSGRYHRGAVEKKDIPKYDIPADCVEANVPQTLPVRGFCSRIASSDSLRSEFWWRPHLEGRFGERLDWLISACESAHCPDIVIMDSGPWYAKIGPLFHGDYAVARTTRFIGEMAALEERIKRLAALTRVVWKLDEQFMPEAALDTKMNVTARMMVLSTVVYDTAMRVPGIAVWSSGIAESMQFYHEVCRPNRESLKGNKMGTVMHECFDPMHVGGTVRWKMLQSLFNVLFLDISTTARDLCCGT